MANNTCKLINQWHWFIIPTDVCITIFEFPLFSYSLRRAAIKDIACKFALHVHLRSAVNYVEHFMPSNWTISTSARSNPTARRGRNHPEFFKIFMHTWVKLSALSMGQSIGLEYAWKFWKIRDDFDPDGQLDSIAPALLVRTAPTSAEKHYRLTSKSSNLP